MRKEAWTYSLTGAILGAFGLLLRWLQWQMIYEEETGLPIQNAPVSYLLVVFLIAAAAGLWVLSGRLGADHSAAEPEQAMAITNRIVGVLLAVAALAAGAGALLMVLTEESFVMRFAALLGVVAAAVLALYSSLSRWGGFGAFLSLVPVIFFSVWIVIFYKDNSVNPVVWSYAMQILAIAACLFAVYRLCGYLFYRIQSRRSVFACALAEMLCLCTLMDDTSLGSRVLFAGWAVGCGVMCWVLWRNMVLPEEQQAAPEAE
ncbi:MAG: hypothetical protein IKQ10_09965 [Oscillospiraceae bacterium]|nr:hypothetical protein [Oscillospiraceae bacterium]